MKKNKLRHKKIIAESFYSEKNNGIGIIFCPGIPGKSNYEDVVKKYVNDGFVFIQPKYIGSWESYGSFSVEKSRKTIIDFTNSLLKGETNTIFNESFDVDINKIYLLGHSFGGSIALCAGAESDVDGIIALAPVTDYKRQREESGGESLSWLYKFIKKGFENVYRGLEKNKWEQFCKTGGSINASDYLNKLKNKRILLMHGKKDKTVLSKQSKNFYEKLKKINDEISYYETEDTHSEIKYNSYKKILSWINKN